MRVLVYENTNKTRRIIKDLPIDDVVKELESDNGLIEAISTHDSRILVRLFFDIDEYDMSNDPLNEALRILCVYFGCSKEDWAIATANRPDKYSYHIVSKTSCSTLRNLRDVTKELNLISNVFDVRMLYCSINDTDECIYFRLPNQSKQIINKVSPPLHILYGRISDFIITDVGKLHIIKI